MIRANTATALLLVGWPKRNAPMATAQLAMTDASTQLTAGLCMRTASTGRDAAPRGSPGNEALAECGCRTASIFDLLAGDVHIRGSRRCCR